MEGNFSSGSMMQGNGSYVDFDLRGPMRVHHGQQHTLALHQQHHQPHAGQGSSTVLPTIHANFPLTLGRMQDRDKTVSQADYSERERGKSASDEDEQTCMEENDLSRGKKASPWQRVKWTDTMVRLLITSVSYISEEAASEDGGGVRRKCSNLQKKGKWKLVSKVMAQRGHFVSPQQCEDKFNDLNKRYKRLNEILGRGTSCEVVENPMLLDRMDHISAKAKEEVLKILSSKHLHYEEMCSYHNGNRLHLPPDPELQHSLRLALRSRDNEDEDVKRHTQDDDEEIELDGRDESEENPVLFGDHRAYKTPGSSAKRIKQCHKHEQLGFGNSLDGNRTSNIQQENAGADTTQVQTEGMKENMLQKQWINHRTLQLEEKRLHIQSQMLELEKERFKWQRFCQKKDRELEMTRLEIENMKLENERMAFELRQKEIGFDNR
ncbi:uncharacterized protein LOC111376151 [Olea europaea var. sylvestris]|uniref:Myb/SANT-like DNA-binding domain-containing protein n=1 Tax=Olea europaea subsp. europaea TaxID=158383 RepID=A0A8S0V9Q1_OLEEU|nr:uncharacterized protein LOC111376151 [Olea europaea var. sylvestris]CAA3030285.1 Hypothetical predicted protein [Olea europaea subsp. europaea]